MRFPSREWVLVSSFRSFVAAAWVGNACAGQLLFLCGVFPAQQNVVSGRCECCRFACRALTRGLDVGFRFTVAVVSLMFWAAVLVLEVLGVATLSSSLPRATRRGGAKLCLLVLLCDESIHRTARGKNARARGI